jgi:HK97 family phage portal protein
VILFDWLVKRRPRPDERMLTPSQVWGSGGHWRPLTGAGLEVTAEAAMQAAIGSCIRLIADDISALPVDVIRKVDDDSVPSNRPAWLEYPTGRRWDTFQAFTSDVVVSLLSDGNAFVECAPDTFSPRFFSVKDPGLVKIEVDDTGAVVYKTKDRTYTEAQMAHVPWVRMPGKLRGLSVLEASKESTGLELAARQWAGAFFRNGGTLGGVIEHPTRPSKEELDLMRETFESRHQGSENAFKLGIITGGAKLQQGSIKPDEASLEPLWKHVLEEAARLYHIPPHLLGSQDPGGSSFASVEHRSIEYVQHAIVPVTTRLEGALSRFLGRDRFIKYNVNALLRGDIATRAQWYTFAVQNKVMRPAEVRAKEDLPPDPENTGYLETPNNSSEPAQEEEPQAEAASIVINDVELRDEAASQLTERVVEAVVVGNEQTVTDLAQLQADLIGKSDRDHEATRAEMRERIDALEARIEADRLAALQPLQRNVQRDDKGRIVGVVERQGDRMVRKIIERDATGAVITMTEVAA